MEITVCLFVPNIHNHPYEYIILQTPYNMLDLNLCIYVILFMFYSILKRYFCAPSALVDPELEIINSQRICFSCILYVVSITNKIHK